MWKAKSLLGDVNCANLEYGGSTGHTWYAPAYNISTFGPDYILDLPGQDRTPGFHWDFPFI